MKKYVTINSISGEFISSIQWNDDREFSSDIMLMSNQEIITVDSSKEVLVSDVYDKKTKQFYILDISDEEIEIEELNFELSKAEEELSEFQEETWRALDIDESKLSQVWQDRLLQKRTLRERLALIVEKE